MKLIGYWITSLTDEEYPAPQEFVGALDPDVRTILANYLDSDTWPTIGSYFGYSWCRFFCGISSPSMGSSEVGDGTWAWPKGLSHYVREHNVLLPREFVDHVLLQGSNVGRSDALAENPETESRLVTGTPGISLAYWRKWCSTQRSAGFLNQLHLARIEAIERADTEESRMTTELVAKRGLGEDVCAWADCDKQVVSGTTICPRHTVTHSQPHSLESRRSHHYFITPEFMADCFGSEIT